MNREEWYIHTTMDHLERIVEYIDIVLDGAIDSPTMTDDDVCNLQHLLYKLQHHLKNRLNKEYP